MTATDLYGQADLFPDATRQARRARRRCRNPNCDRWVYVDRAVFGYGENCAEDLGLIPPTRHPGHGQTGPDLFTTAQEDTVMHNLKVTEDHQAGTPQITPAGGRILLRGSETETGAALLGAWCRANNIDPTGIDGVTGVTVDYDARTLTWREHQFAAGKGQQRTAPLQVEPDPATLAAGGWTPPVAIHGGFVRADDPAEPSTMRRFLVAGPDGQTIAQGCLFGPAACVLRRPDRGTYATLDVALTDVDPADAARAVGRLLGQDTVALTWIDGPTQPTTTAGSPA